MYDGEGDIVPYDAAYYGELCDEPLSPLTCYNYAPFTTQTLYATQCDICRDGNDCLYAYSLKSDAVYVDTEGPFEDYPEAGIETKIDNYIGFTIEMDGASSDTPCAFFIEVMRMHQGFSRPMGDPEATWELWEEHGEDGENLGFGFHMLGMSADMEELCNDWPIDGVFTGGGPTVSGNASAFEGTISFVPNECCVDGEDACVVGTPTAEGHCTSSSSSGGADSSSSSGG